MIKRIKNWFYNYREKRRRKQRRKQTLKIIKKAKQVYLDDEQDCMCRCFMSAEPSFLCYKDIVKIIPEFTPPTFGIHKIHPISYWWDISDRESRVNAFNKLIEIYSK